MSIGAHTLSHPCCRCATRKKYGREIQQSKMDLERGAGAKVLHSPIPSAILPPWGARKTSGRGAGSRCAFVMSNGGCCASDAFALPLPEPYQSGYYPPDCRGPT